ncbi:MAG: 2-hydroxyacyl-CoA dehydratase [Deltaproteobacteria bacterium]|nr:2-hydroxyacyl-CoA dehydratase [Deltaproteobacteria bacterium]
MNAIKRLRKLQGEGKKIVGCFPLYPPVELFYAMELVPVVLWGLTDAHTQTPKSDRHLQNYTCFVARDLTEFILTQGHALLDGIFMYNACDTLRNLPEIFIKETKASGGSLPLIRMHLPMSPQDQTDSSKYFNDEINAVIRSFTEDLGTSFSSERFEEGIRLYNRMRKLAIFAQHRVARGRMGFLPFADTMRNACFMPVGEQVSALESLLRMYPEDSGDPNDSKTDTGVILSGILPPPPSIIAAIESAGMRVVGNDIASLHRSYADIPAPESDPCEYYRDFYFHHTPCSTLLFSGDRRLQTLMDMVDKTGAMGVIFVGEKFCEYEYFEFPYLEKELRKKGVKTLRIEISMQDDAHAGGISSRIEAFAEMTAS